MTNVGVILVISLLLVMDIMTVVISLVQKGMRGVTSAFFALSVCVIGWLLSDLTYQAATNPDAIMFLLNLKFSFVAFCPVALVVLTLRFYRLDRFVTRRLKVLLSIVPCITTVLALTSLLHPLMRSHQVLVAIQPLHIVDQSQGVWFWVHAAYCYALTLFSAGVVIAQHKKLPSGYRASSVVLLLAMGINLVANALSIIVFSDFGMDFSLLGMGGMLVFIYLAVATSSKTDLLEIARDEIFNYLQEYVFILDLQQQVLEANHTGRQWLSRLGIQPNFPFPLARVFDALRERGATIRENAEQDAGTDIYYSHNDRGVVYNMTERFVVDKKGRPMGVYTTLVDITRYKQVIDQLEKAVDIDPLTGLANRRAYENLMQFFDDQKTTPLCIVLGDANGLKRVNDTLGHQQGDVLLRLLAQQMKHCCPRLGTVARIGGDEFAVLMPGGNAEDARQLVQCVETALAEQKDYPFTPSIALGWAERRVTHDGPEAVENTVYRADIEMYRNKENDRRRRR